MIMTAVEEPATKYAGVGFGRGARISSQGLAAACGLVDRLPGVVAEAATAGLVLSEILILLAGVTSRYVVHNPLIWSDELAAILFLWLSMPGAVIAFRRGEHMRMTALVPCASPRLWEFLEATAVVAPWRADRDDRDGPRHDRLSQILNYDQHQETAS